MTFSLGYNVSKIVVKSGWSFTPRKVTSGFLILISYPFFEGFGIDFKMELSLQTFFACDSFMGPSPYKDTSRSILARELRFSKSETPQDHSFVYSPPSVIIFCICP